ncbi:unnamed protein product, partial [marine sediment metagenome]
MIYMTPSLPKLPLGVILVNKESERSDFLGLDKLYPIIPEIFFIDSLNPEKWTFKQLSKFYQKPNSICLSSALGVIYKHSHYD